MSISLEILPSADRAISEQEIVQRLNEQFNEKFVFAKQINGATISIGDEVVCLMGTSTIEPSVFEHEVYIDGVKGLDKIDSLRFLKNFKEMDHIYTLESKAPRHNLSLSVLLFYASMLAEFSDGLIILDQNLDNYEANTVYLFSEIVVSKR